MNVSACLVTRGDVDMQPILDSLPGGWEVVMWQNADSERGSETIVRRWATRTRRWPQFAVETRLGHAGLSVYGRYAAIDYASHDLIYVADDDVIVSDPQAIVDAWQDWSAKLGSGLPGFPESAKSEHVVCNMPPEFRHDFYREHALVGFGAAFHRDAPERAFIRFDRHGDVPVLTDEFEEARLRCCDVIFTALTPRVLVDVPKENLPYAEADNRMYRQTSHVGERTRMLELALKVRDA